MFRVEKNQFEQNAGMSGNKDTQGQADRGHKRKARNRGLMSCFINQFVTVHQFLVPLENAFVIFDSFFVPRGFLLPQSSMGGLLDGSENG